MVTSGFVQGKRARLQVYEHGAGPQVMVLVHGYSASARGWRLTQEALDPAKYRTIAVNNRGAGESDRPTDEGAYTVEGFAEDLLDAVTTLGLQDFTLVGHSMGGATVTQFALDNPSLAKGLVLLNSTPLLGRTPPEGWEQQIRKDYEAGAFSIGFGPNTARIPTDFAEALLGDVARNPLERALGGRRSMAGLQLRKELGRLTMPVLVVGGDLDDTVGVDNILLDFLALPEERRFLHMFHAIAHSPNFENPKELTAVLDAFVDRVDAMQGAEAAAD